MRVNEEHATDHLISESCLKTKNLYEYISSNEVDSTLNE